jgi:conjugal transfer pilus assembly protein TraE
MDFNHSIAQGQRVLKQRNMLAIVAAVLGALVVLLFVIGATRDREVILQPIMRSPLTISSSGVSPDYLELVTRDTALMTLNRSPANLDYWMNSVLDVAAPESHGALKRDLLKIVEEQRGSSVSQFFTIERLKVDPVHLVSEVSGILHTVVASKEVTAEPKRFRFTWKYEGLSLRLKGFGMISLKDNEEAQS